jgi:hypothetical protein
MPALLSGSTNTCGYNGDFPGEFARIGLVPVPDSADLAVAATKQFSAATKQFSSWTQSA